MNGPTNQQQCSLQIGSGNCFLCGCDGNIMHMIYREIIYDNLPHFSSLPFPAWIRIQQPWFLLSKGCHGTIKPEKGCQVLVHCHTPLFLQRCSLILAKRAVQGEKTKINNGHRDQGAHVLKLIAHYIEFSGVPRHALLVRKPNMLCVPCSRYHGPSHKTQSWAIIKLPHEAKTC